MFVDLRNIQFVEVSNCFTTANQHNYTALLLGPPLQPKAKQQESWNKLSLVLLMCPFSRPSKDLLCCQKTVLSLRGGVAFHPKAFTCNRTAGLPRGDCAASCSNTNNWLHPLPFLLSHKYCMHYALQYVLRQDFSRITTWGWCWLKSSAVLNYSPPFLA